MEACVVSWTNIYEILYRRIYDLVTRCYWHPDSGSGFAVFFCSGGFYADHPASDRLLPAVWGSRACAGHSGLRHARGVVLFVSACRACFVKEIEMLHRQFMLEIKEEIRT